jgi:ADP-heptose:LPS heptosyltransferase
MSTRAWDNRARKICIVQLGRIGDLLLITPLFSALKAAHPGNELHLIAGRNNYAIAAGNPCIDRVHVYTKRPWGTLRLIAMLRTTTFDVWLDPKEHKSTESSVLARLAQAPMKIGFRGDTVFTHPACEQKAGGEHYAARSLRNLEYLGIENAPSRPSLPHAPSYDAAFDEFRKANAVSGYFAVNISASGPVRYWKDEKWAELLNWLPRECGPAVLLSEPRDKQRVHAIARRVPRSCVFETPSILGTIPVVKNASLVLTVDTCIVHVAAAFNIPVVALYVNLPEFFVQYLPLSDMYRAVLSPVPGAAVEAIPVFDVREAVRSLLHETGALRSAADAPLPSSVLKNMQ